MTTQKKKIKKILRILLRTVLFVAGFFVLYALAGLTVPYISVNKNAAQSGEDGYEMYILSNGVHTDLVVPIRTEVKDWTMELSFENTVSKDTAMNYVGFGWGDKGFYLNTPTWADLKTSTAFNAMFGLSTSAMHVTFHGQPAQGKLCRKTWVSKADYQKLVSFIEHSFQRDANGKFMYISGYAYGKDDGFYEAHRVYNLFYTCNTWANAGLKKANMKACLWTPLDKGILRLYE